MQNSNSVLERLHENSAVYEGSNAM